MYDVMGSLLIAMVTGMALGPVLLPFLHKLKIGQSIRQEGPKSHLSKAGTPTMGGLIFLAGMLVSTLIMRNFSREVAFVLSSTLGFGLIGFLDDYIKVVLKRNLGLKAYQKIIGQLVVGTILAVYAASLFGTDIYIPLINRYFDLGILYVPFILFILVATTNSVNLTDGLDGLAGTVTSVVLFFFVFAADILGLQSLVLLAFAFIGGLAGFLRYNRFPARVFMGDLGSLSLGGAVAGFAIATKLPLLIPIVGFIYLVEAISVILQVASFKTRGKRIFRMSPIHHHFELGGWNEVKVVRVFSGITIALSIVGFLLIK